MTDCDTIWKTKGRYEYPTTVTLSYNLMLEWQPEPSSMQGGEIQRDNRLEFEQNNQNVDRKEQQRFTKTSHATSASRSATTSGHDPSKWTDKRNLGIKESAMTTSCK